MQVSLARLVMSTALLNDIRLLFDDRAITMDLVGEGSGWLLATGGHGGWVSRTHFK